MARKGNALNRTSIMQLLCAALALTSLQQALAGPVVYELKKSGSVPVHVITVDLSSSQVAIQPQLASGGVGASESFRSMLRRTRPIAAITGAFFDIRSKIPVSDIAINGQWIQKGSVGNGICIDESGALRFVPRWQGHTSGWKGYTSVLCGGPTLVKKGKVALYPHNEGFRDSGLFGRSQRTAAGHTYNNKLLLVSVNKPIKLRRLAHIMRGLGCKDAITLDGGSSTGLWFNGKVLSQPRRHLTNLLAVYIVTPRDSISSAIARRP